MAKQTKPTSQSKAQTKSQAEKAAVEKFIRGLKAPQRAIAQELHKLCHTELGLTAKIRFKLPFYYQNTWICYISPLASGTVELAFIRGNELDGSREHLNPKNRKQVYGIEFSDVSEIDMGVIMAVMHEAIVLDETVPYSVSKK